MEIVTKMELMVEAWGTFAADPEWDALFRQQDLGFPAAYFVLSEAAVMTEELQDYIEASWDAMLAYLGLDALGEYDSLDEMLAIANDPDTDFGAEDE